ncbi:sensor domain-containing diguanylate cyclase [Mesobacterium pallidum]|uniref:GGDEF domain-containing protein n=1 Tax=Mesobacterium pallidum TaxID=2872037 RepID=UPI001EE1DB27|nr:GGDEF domain-containing protein [Mesobacterium pallidum]
MSERLLNNGTSIVSVPGDAAGQTRLLLERVVRLRHVLLIIAFGAWVVMMMDHLVPPWVIGADGVARPLTNPLTLACVALALGASAMVRPNRTAEPVELILWLCVTAMAALFPVSPALATYMFPAHVSGATCANTALVMLCLGCARLCGGRLPPLALFAALLASLLSSAGLVSHLLHLDLIFRQSSEATMVALLALSLVSLLGHFRKHLVWSLVTRGQSGRFLRLSMLAWGVLALLVPAMLSTGIVPMALLPAVYLAVMVAWLAIIMHFHARYARLLWQVTHAQGFTLRDRLTGAFTRVAAQQAFAAAPDHVGLGVVMIDLDDFKSVNDRFGHPRGDAVLIDTVAAMRRELRISDLLVRWGGDEFIAILQIDSVTDLLGVADRLRAAVSTVSPDPDGSGQLMASVGVTMARPEVDPELDAWVAEVDAALYAAKNAGKNRVSVAPSLRSEMFAALVAAGQADATHGPP